MNGRILQAFTQDEAVLVRQGLEELRARLRHVPGGGKLEEDYWANVYRTAKKIQGEDKWSNMPFQDFIHKGIGVEWKLLRRNNPIADQGKTIMHPAATRTIKYDPSQTAEQCKNVVLNQWAAKISNFRERVRATSKDGRMADIRWGILLWSPNLDEFLYFEEELVEPKPSEFRADWEDGNHRGNRTRNLYIYDRTTDAKRYSVTLPEKGAKIQPYFTIPSPEEGAHIFKTKEAAAKLLLVTPQTYDDLVNAASAAGLSNDLFVEEILNAYLAAVKKRR